MQQFPINKKIKIPNHLVLSYASVHKTNLLLLQTKMGLKKYIFLPNCIHCQKMQDRLLLSLTIPTRENEVTFNKFVPLVETYFNAFEKPIKKKLLLKGLGFRLTLNKETNTLELKVGYSHLVFIQIPTKSINIRIDKLTLTVEGFDKTEVGNFTQKIRDIKFPDNYKGKGFWYKNEIIALKEVKKT